eukprot:11220531-Lingulodinium_polyedra.AAC.1
MAAPPWGPGARRACNRATSTPRRPRCARLPASAAQKTNALASSQDHRTDCRPQRAYANTRQNAPDTG